MGQDEKNEVTRDIVLDAAETLFADKGFHAVTVREITALAGCNLSAINYYFGGKDRLYLEVFRERWMPRAQRVQDFFRKRLAARAPLSTEAVIQSLAEAFLEGPLNDAERLRHSLLMSREMAYPSEAFKLLAENVMKPFFQSLADLLKSTMPGPTDEERLRLDILSTFAMVAYFNHARAAVSLIMGRDYDASLKKLLVEHITRFVRGGMGIPEKEEGR